MIRVVFAISLALVIIRQRHSNLILTAGEAIRDRSLFGSGILLRTNYWTLLRREQFPHRDPWLLNV